jgi:hypothetical protein
MVKSFVILIPVSFEAKLKKMNKKTAFIVIVDLLRNLEKLGANNVLNVSIVTNNL